MDPNIIKSFHGMFLMTGLFACLNAWAGKWGPAFALLGMSLLSFAAGMALDGSFFAIIPALLLVAVVTTLRYSRQPSDHSEIAAQDDPRAVSEAMLAEMNRNIAAHKSRV